MKKQTKAEFVQWMGPLLDALRELGDSGTPKEVSDLIARNLKIPDKKKEELMESGSARFHNQVCWARQYLVWEGLISSEKRGVWQLTKQGRETFLNNETSRVLFKKWVEVHTKERKSKQGSNQPSESKETADEKIENIESLAELSHREKLLNVLWRISPDGFERLCKYILRLYGFENVQVTPKGRDGGIDGFGTLQLNPFVSFRVIFQCKRYKGTVSRAQVGDLRNAMIGRADKGIMMTTGNFSEDAKREAEREGAPPIELIDAEALIDLMEKEEIGLKPKTVYDVDYQFFEKYMD
ncbi:MAG: restriction endonuclease [Candidatus Riflebacteria bacterium]|nr:restriction endonuclease [Candidatus Riflebacteria bacterium]